MENFRYVDIPYTAPGPLPDRLPTWGEILDTWERKGESGPTRRGRHILKMGKHYMVKFGWGVSFSEGDFMLLVRKYTNIPIPKLYHMSQHRDAQVIIMEYIDGKPLKDMVNTLSYEWKASIGRQLRRHLAELRSIPSPGYYGLPGRRRYLDHHWILKKRMGPFHTSYEFLDAYLTAHFPISCSKCQREATELKREFAQLTRHFDKPVFSHVDLHSGNILVRNSDGRICILDWESGGFYPEWLEFIGGDVKRTAGWGLLKDYRDPMLDSVDYGKLNRIMDELHKICNRRPHVHL